MSEVEVLLPTPSYRVVLSQREIEFLYMLMYCCMSHRNEAPLAELCVQIESIIVGDDGSKVDAMKERFGDLLPDCSAGCCSVNGESTR